MTKCIVYKRSRALYAFVIELKNCGTWAKKCPAAIFKPSTAHVDIHIPFRGILYHRLCMTLALAEFAFTKRRNPRTQWRRFLLSRQARLVGSSWAMHALCLWSSLALVHFEFELGRIIWYNLRSIMSRCGRTQFNIARLGYTVREYITKLTLVE